MALQPNLSKGLTITWTTEKPFKDRCRVSSDFSLGETTWYLKMESNVNLFNTYKRYYSVSLIERENRKPRKPFTVVTGIVMTSGKKNPFRDTCDFCTVKTNKQSIWDCSMDEISSAITGFEDYAEMMVVSVFKDLPPSMCRIRNETNDLSTQTDIEWPLTSHLPPALLRDVKCSKDITCELDSLSGELSSLLEKQHFADIELKCGGRSFSVHRSILVARSGYFADEFKVKSVENEPLTVSLPDAHADILDPLLKFVYSGKIPSLNDESAFKLLAVGRMYAVRGLQKGCLEWMGTNLSQKNCVAFLAVSGEYDDDAFKNMVVSFIVSHPDVLKSENWKKFSKVPSKLANEVYENFVTSVFDKSNLAN